MGSYILNFTVYTMAMCGLISFALFVYKKFAQGSFMTRPSNFLNVEETLSLAPRKTLYVVRAGQERFLIAADADKTNLISKLEVGQNIGQTYQSTSASEFQAQLDQVYPTEQRVQRTQQHVRQPQQYAYRQPQNNSYQQPNQYDYNIEKTTLIGVDDFPEIRTNKRAKTSNDIIKNMANRMKG
ncbi:flagellar biosynthetic protein FliO [bacterium]|nr:flagellar biosynthetic protein FliO [bacterium]